MTTEISRRAHELATAHPLSEVLENAFLGFFAVLGGFIGYVFLAASWASFQAYKLGFVIVLAFADGFKKTAHVPPKQPSAEVAPPTGPPITDMTQVGPAAFAWSEKG